MYSRNVTYLYFYNLTFRKTNIYCSKHSIKHNFLQIYTFSTRREQTDLCWHLRVVFFFFFQSLWRLVRLVLSSRLLWVEDRVPVQRFWPSCRLGGLWDGREEGLHLLSELWQLKETKKKHNEETTDGEKKNLVTKGSENVVFSPKCVIFLVSNLQQSLHC